MPVAFVCPHCGKRYANVKRRLMGRRARCGCGKIIRIAGESLGSEANQPDVIESSASVARDANVETASSADLSQSIVDEHYSDLDQILARPVLPSDAPASEGLAVPGSPRDFGWQTSAKTESELRKERSRGSFSSTTGLAIGFMGLMLSASLAIWFGLLLVVTRFRPVDLWWLRSFNDMLQGVFRGQFGSAPLTQSLEWSFVLAGWCLWLLALSMIGLGALQLVNAIALSFWLRSFWSLSDGALATVSILFVFVGVCTLFLHTSHTAQRRRELNQYDSPAAVLSGETTLENVQRLRTEVYQESRRFLVTMLATNMVPLCVFGGSMMHMLLSRPTPAGRHGEIRDGD